jgi:hypothetical protein
MSEDLTESTALLGDGPDTGQLVSQQSGTCLKVVVSLVISFLAHFFSKPGQPLNLAFLEAASGPLHNYSGRPGY